MLIVLGMAVTVIVIYVAILSFYLLMFACLFLFVYYILSNLEEDTEAS